ncbi:BREX-2 system phosphatase PglZ [Polyangium spumosum]|uniref:BREX-2 system phosphatase PglZ n=1 Tax=Polyangium spumosum TaxID=889282 RepID=A0A6N7Q3X5_9BACT|nr:BREX-2 system phosphatase PglZ [Polyangium spumosum]MRG98407.1 BREX-2 system phosphatase PglZ [Polyangium spumosum]
METPELLRKLVEMAGGPAAQGYVLALDGDGLESVPQRVQTSQATYEVCRPRTELELRRMVWKSSGAPFIAILPPDLARSLPADLLHRARRRRVHALDIQDVLSVVLGVPVVGTDDRAVQRLALDHLEALRAQISQRTHPTVIDRQLLDELLLDVCFGSGERLRARSPGALLAEWVEHPPDWDESVRELVRRNLPRLHATEGRILAWALASSERLRALVVRGVLLAIDGEVPEAVWGELEALQKDQQVGVPPDVLRGVLSRIAVEAIEELKDDAKKYLTEAETIGRRHLSKDARSRSTILPLGLANRCEDVAQRVARGEPVPSSEITWMREHRAAGLMRNEISLLEEMARFSRYLATPDAEEAGPELAGRIRSYQKSGAFADMSAARLRRALASTAQFHEQAEKALVAYQERRNRDNLAFAKTLARGYVEALHKTEGVVPLHRLWTDVALRRPKDEGLFLVVLDGCSYPAFVEIVEELAQLGEPLGLRAPERDSATGLLALSLLPTITSHARGAIFLGEIPKDPLAAESVWREEGERSTDPARFKQNKVLGNRTRKLFLKGDLAEGPGPLLRALQDTSIEIVAAVFNAIDDQIGSANTGAQLQVKPDQISGFIPSLQAALAHGRSILVVADHGHTPFWNKALRVGAGSTPRFCELGPKEAAPDGFVEVNVEELGGSSGRKAFAWRMGAYQGSPQVGFHGGVGLEEMVVPLAWLVRDGVRAGEPSWWFGPTHASAAEMKVRPAEPLAKATAPTRQQKKAAPAPPAAKPIQTDLYDRRPSIEALAVDADRLLGLPADVMEGLEPDERAVLTLLARHGSARMSEVARVLGKPAARVGGWMAKLHRKLHDVGAPCFSTDRLPNGEQQYTFVPPERRRNA